VEKSKERQATKERLAIRKKKTENERWSCRPQEIRCLACDDSNQDPPVTVRTGSRSYELWSYENWSAHWKSEETLWELGNRINTSIRIEFCDYSLHTSFHYFLKTLFYIL
jgi:hypothetical protein